MEKCRRRRRKKRGPDGRKKEKDPWKKKGGGGKEGERVGRRGKKPNDDAARHLSAQSLSMSVTIPSKELYGVP